MKTLKERVNKEKNRPVKISITELIRGKAAHKIKGMIPQMANIVHPFIKNIMTDKYRPEVQEIRRAMNKVIERQYGANNEKLEKLRDISCMIMQYEDTYFYWLLDFFNELDISKLKLPLDKEDIEYHRERWSYNFPKEHLKC